MRFSWRRAIIAILGTLLILISSYAALFTWDASGGRAPVWGVTAIGSLLVSVCLSRGGVLVRAVRVSKQSESTHAPVG